MRKTKLSFDLFARQHGNDGLFARFYRHPGSAILLQKQVSKASIAKIVGVSLPPFTALSRQGGYAHTLKGYFHTNLGGTLIPLDSPGGLKLVGRLINRGVVGLHFRSMS
jgi:hypothetical protein